MYIARSKRRQSAFAVAQREEADKLLTVGLKLVRDTGVRWNNTYYKIKKALKLHRAIGRYCKDWKKPDKDADDVKQETLDAQD